MIITGLNKADGVLFKPVPAGLYTATIGECKIVPTKDGTKQMLKFKFRILGGDNDGRVVFHNILIPSENLSATANELAVNRIKKLIIACNLSVDGDELEPTAFTGATLQIDVGIRTDPTTNRENNDINDYLPAS